MGKNQVSGQILLNFQLKNSGSTLTNQMKNIPHSTLPNFHGMESEDPYTFLSEFDVLYSSYDYVMDQHRLKIFPGTLKNHALRWFMGLGGDIIST